jgi:hypothetical protein
LVADFTWQAITGLGYSFGSFELIGAYRHLEWDFGSDNSVADISFSGVENGGRSPDLSLPIRQKYWDEIPSVLP